MAINIGIALGFVVIVLLFLVLSRRAGKGTIRALISGVQQLSVLLLFDVEWPEIVVRLRNGINAVNLDLSLMSPACLGLADNYYIRFVGSVLLALTALLIVWSPLLRWIGTSRQNEGFQQSFYNRIKDSVLLLLLVHPTLSGQAFFLFRCRRIPSSTAEGGAVYYLMVDLSLRCFDDAWTRMSILSGLLIIGLAVGAPAMLVWILWRRRRTLQEPATRKKWGALCK